MTPKLVLTPALGAYGAAGIYCFEVGLVAQFGKGLYTEYNFSVFMCLLCFVCLVCYDTGNTQNTGKNMRAFCVGFCADTFLASINLREEFPEGTISFFFNLLYKDTALSFLCKLPDFFIFPPVRLLVFGVIRLVYYDTVLVL